ncbi:MAG: radical SAM protein [Cyanobacteria bacterium NC_groundwater_1444_Ag_S-0.65um_54_12]|nr:radical SAM protein [Cyanobacteria bacterium NC_groundwater_1444_Ag_S-0.65um_54_12]
MLCVYCNDGSGKKYPECSNEGELDTESWLRVLAILRRETDVLIITGGEPTMRQDLRQILEGCQALGYHKVCLLTNGLTLDRHPAIFELCDILMISLDTLDGEKADWMMGRGKGILRHILDNIELACRERSRHKFKLYFNVVITPENIDDVHQVIDYALEHRIGFVPLPEVVGVYPREALKGNLDYQALIDRILTIKRAGGDVMGTMAYLGGIRHFAAYHCLPTLLARVWPNGDLLYPCQKLHKIGGNLLEIGDYAKAIDQGRASHGPLPNCDNRCHVGCYMDFSVCVQQPGFIMKEALRSLRKPFFRPKEFIRG